MSEVTKIHTVDGSTVTVGGDFIAEMNGRPSITDLQTFNEKVLVNMYNVAYMEVVEVSDDD